RLTVWLEKKIPERSQVGTGPLIAHEDFPWAEALERDWRQIRGELDQVLVHYDALPNIQDISTDQYGLTQDDRWKTFFFHAFGDRFDGNCQRCPKTAALLDRVPGITTAFFSILGPGKHLRPHRGYYKGVVRYHLALRVPEDRMACGINVGGELVHWSEGTGFFFDDTYRHEAWNRASQVRIVLLLDVLRPLPFPYSLLNKMVIYGTARLTPIRDARARHDAWERNFEEMMTRKAREQSS
ncbi:MAG: aspartyl/asparaginyl beta-hydroxylase domain-containing protein, partial [Trebonia sp.]